MKSIDHVFRKFNQAFRKHVNQVFENVNQAFEKGGKIATLGFANFPYANITF